MFRKKWLIALVVILVLAAVAGANFYFKKSDASPSTPKASKKRDLEAIVTASGTVQAKRFVNISAVPMGTVTRLAVEEGDRVKTGQFLLEIDPNALRGTVQRGEASVAAAQAGLAQSKVNVETARATSRSPRRRSSGSAISGSSSSPRRSSSTRPRTTSRSPKTELAARQAAVSASAQMINAGGGLARHEPLQPAPGHARRRRSTASSPRRNIEEGENVVVGTMNNAGTQLLTVADMSVIQAEVEVDETDIPTVQIGQPAKITIDALPDQTFTGKVTEIGNSPIQTTTATRPGSRRRTSR